ncbi:MAG TPA: MltA domain-containing protein [Stellaceae bacterium]|jgi:membrane-bound lytic murein transglycosylase A|nr:MltA domain-containing protein [Stellaceae bacterium]
MGKARTFISLGAAVVVAALLAGCAGTPPKPPVPQLTLTQVPFSDLPGWDNDNSADALATFIKSCAARDRQPDSAVIAPAALGMTAAQWRKPCAAARATPNNDAAARAFFAATFTPYLAANNNNSEGLFTGYYEPLLHGARQHGGAYQTPLMKRPPDLVMVDLGRFRPAWHGERIAGRVVSGNLVPYPSRAEIERGVLDANQLALFWVNDPVDAFFLEVQGSGRVELPDRTQVRLGYDGQNGQPYVAIGKKLVERGAMTADQVSLQSIRAWIAAHPDQAKALMDESPSYVFFREMPGDGPVGSEGVVLTAGRSLAVDRKFIPLGTPIYLATDDNAAPLQRLMVAQDTGGAISGPVRGDVFWGFGANAETRAGNMRARGRYYLLLPKDVTLPPAPALS